MCSSLLTCSLVRVVACLCVLVLILWFVFVCGGLALICFGRVTVCLHICVFACLACFALRVVRWLRCLA